MTPTQLELYNSAEFWAKRQREQWAYIDSVIEREYHWEGRRNELLSYAYPVLHMIEKRLAELIKHDT